MSDGYRRAHALNGAETVYRLIDILNDYFRILAFKLDDALKTRDFGSVLSLYITF